MNEEGAPTKVKMKRMIDKRMNTNLLDLFGDLQTHPKLLVGVPNSALHS